MKEIIPGKNVQLHNRLPANVGYSLFQEFIVESKGRESYIPQYPLAVKMIQATVAEWEYPWDLDKPDTWDFDTMDFVKIATAAIGVIIGSATDPKAGSSSVSGST